MLLRLEIYEAIFRAKLSTYAFCSSTAFELRLRRPRVLVAVILDANKERRRGDADCEVRGAKGPGVALEAVVCVG